MKVDYLIVGQGLAGSLLAWELLQRGKRILVVDRDEETTSSKVAAGLVTPLTGAKFKLTPEFENRLRFAAKFYWETEEATGGRFYYHLPILKLFRGEAEAEAWSACDHSAGSPLQPYSAPLNLSPGLLRDEFGGFEMRGGGWLNVPAFLEATRIHLLERAAYAIGQVKAEDVKPSPRGVVWKNVDAGRILFAEGWRADKNRFFDWLTMRSARGDILEVKIPALAAVDRIVNRGAWLLPLGGARFRTGSNYRHDLTAVTPDASGRREIMDGLETITHHPCEVLDHQCAIRPIIRRSQVFCGIHPSFPAVGFLNGLGSKGVVNGPWYAARLIAHLEDREPLPPEADLRGNLI